MGAQATDRTAQVTSYGHLKRYHIVVGDETWICHYEPKS